MKNIITFIIFTAFAFSANAEPHKYSFDKDHTTIMFTINHLGFSNKIGRFDDYDGHFIFDKENPENSAVDVKIRPSGINTGSTSLDKELQKNYWFNTAKYPEIHFKSSKIKISGDNKAEVTGWISMLGKDKPATIEVTFNKMDMNPFLKKYVTGFSAKTTINRSEFGMINGIPFVSDKVHFQIEVEGIRE